MTLIVENGTGIFEANAYAGRGFVRNYLARRNKAGDWDAVDDAVRDAAIIAATDYIDRRFGMRFLGEKQFEDFPVAASNILQIKVLPEDGNTVTIGTVTYTFRAAPAIANEIAIGATILEAAGGLAAAMAGTGGGAGTVAHPTARSDVLPASTDLIVRAILAGQLADPILTSSNNANLVWDYEELIGGTEHGEQQLEFPRTTFEGIPEQLKQAVAEYASRAISEELMPDPEVEANGALVTTAIDTVGPITTHREYIPGVMQIFKKYPEADRLLRNLISAGGGVIR